MLDMRTVWADRAAQVKSNTALTPWLKRRACAPRLVNVVDQVVPHVPVRQCVLSLSIPPRPPLAPQPKLVAPVPHDGLAADGHRPLLGRVLRGLSALPKIAIKARGKQLHQVPLDNSGTMLRTHFLQIDGMGIRDRQFSGDDLYRQPDLCGAQPRVGSYRGRADRSGLVARRVSRLTIDVARCAPIKESVLRQHAKAGFKAGWTMSNPAYSPGWGARRENQT